MTIIKARYKSPCVVAYPDDSSTDADGHIYNRKGERIGPGEVELCDGIKVGDEIVYQIVAPGFTAARLSYKGNSPKRTSVGHLACRAQEHSRKVVGPVETALRDSGQDIDIGLVLREIWDNWEKANQAPRRANDALGVRL
jgi:hypothetical protein